jgi:hypothetical protein
MKCANTATAADLCARANEGAEQVLLWREAEHVAVHVLPAGLLLLQRSCGAQTARARESDSMH